MIEAFGKQWNTTMEGSRRVHPNHPNTVFTDDMVLQNNDGTATGMCQNTRKRKRGKNNCAKNAVHHKRFHIRTSITKKQAVWPAFSLSIKIKSQFIVTFTQNCIVQQIFIFINNLI